MNGTFLNRLGLSNTVVEQLLNTHRPFLTEKETSGEELSQPVPIKLDITTFAKMTADKSISSTILLDVMAAAEYLFTITNTVKIIIQDPSVQVPECFTKESLAMWLGDCVNNLETTRLFACLDSRGDTDMLFLDEVRVNPNSLREFLKALVTERNFQKGEKTNGHPFCIIVVLNGLFLCHKETIINQLVGRYKNTVLLT